MEFVKKKVNIDVLNTFITSPTKKVMMMISRLAPPHDHTQSTPQFRVEDLAAKRPGPLLEIEVWTGCGREGGPAD